MKIQIDPHSLERANERGTNKKEIIVTITAYVFYGKWE